MSLGFGRFALRRANHAIFVNCKSIVAASTWK